MTFSGAKETEVGIQLPRWGRQSWWNEGVCDPPGTLGVNEIEVKSGGLWSRLSGFISLPSTYFMILGKLLNSRCLSLLICK